MVMNGTDRQKSARELLDELERAKEEEARAERNRLTEEVAELKTLMRQLVEHSAPKPEPLRRSAMSAKAKSDYIRHHTLAEYQALPW